MFLLRRILVAAVVVTVAAMLATTSALADPSGSKNSLTFPASCNGTAVILVVNSANGQGSGSQNQTTAPFAPAHVVGSNAIFHPTAFNLTFSFTPAGGTTFSFPDTATMRNARTPVTCTINFSQTDTAGNTFAINGTAAGYFS
jgi:hypothetical protein